MPEVRLLGLVDLPALTELQNSCFSSPWNSSHINRQLENSRGISLGIFNNQALIGFAFFTFVLDEAELLQIAVDPRQRNQGAAKTLLIEGIRLLKKADVLRLMLEVRASNCSAIGLYKSQSFVDDGCRKGYYRASDTESTPEDALLMSVDIDSVAGVEK